MKNILSSKVLLGVLVSFCYYLPLANASDISMTVDAVKSYRIDNEKNILTEYMSLLKMPNNSGAVPEMYDNANHIMKMMEKRGIKTRLLEVENSPPAVYGEIITPGATKTVVFYAHYDGQPVAIEKWDSPPFEPVFRTDFPYRGGKDIAFNDLKFPIDPNIRIFSRSAADDRAPIMAMLATVDAMKKAGIPLSMNIKFFFDGEEERGSPHMSEILSKHKDLLDADLWLFCDGPMHQTGKKTLIFGARSGFGMNVTVYGSVRALHSGHYGNFTPNPNVELAHLITSMRDEDSNILIDGFYDQVVMPTEREMEIINSQVNNDENLKYDLAIKRQESSGKRYEESILLPGLNIRSIETSKEGGGVIPTTASMSVRLRTVPNMEGDFIRDRYMDHFKKQGYHVVHEDPDTETLRNHEKVAKVTFSGGGKPAIRTSVELPVSQALISLMKEHTNDDMIIMPSMGGGLPMAPIKDVMKKDIIILPIANFDNNQHAPNENLRLGNLWDGMETFGAIFGDFGNRF